MTNLNMKKEVEKVIDSHIPEYLLLAFDKVKRHLFDMKDRHASASYK